MVNRAEETGGGKPRYEAINREQLCWRVVDVERLIGEEHAARAILSRPIRFGTRDK